MDCIGAPCEPQIPADSGLLALAARPLPLPGLTTRARAQQGPAGAAVDWLVTFGDLKYPAGFKQFDYINAGAPKGGVNSWEIAIGTFDNFNMVVAGMSRQPATGITLIYDTLLAGCSTRFPQDTGSLPKPALSRRFFLRRLPAASRSKME